MKPKSAHAEPARGTSPDQSRECIHIEADLYREILDAVILVASRNGADDIRTLLAHEGFKHVELEQDLERAPQAFATQNAPLLILDVDGIEPGQGAQLISDAVATRNGVYGAILAITSVNDRDLRRAAVRAGAKDVIDRPLDAVEAAARVRNRLEFAALMARVQNQNAQLETKVRDRTLELHASQLDLVHRLARAAEFRDNDTGNHVARMSLYAAELGRAAGLREEECQLLLNASALHDIGKIGIADQILLKPGTHTAEETRAMRTHVDMGVAILSGSDHELLQWAETIARTHHEHWDGTGYPTGLAGDEIPLVGRIVAICDVFDALTTPRPYKRAWPVELAVDEIRRGAGSHFDPRLVDLFLEILPRLTMIQNSYATALSEFYS